jgi:hypothetical protein
MNISEYTEKLMVLANNELIGDEKMQLEKEIQENPALSEEFKKHRLAQELLEAFISQNLKKKLNDFPLPQENHASQGSVIKKLKPFHQKWAIAASFALMVGLSSYIFVKNEFAYPHLADNYNLQMQEVRGTISPSDDILGKASTYMSNKQSEMAIALLTSITVDDDRFYPEQLLLGNAFFTSQNYPAASKAFRRSAMSSDEDLKLKGQYGFLLCQLKLNIWTEENRLMLLALSQNENFIYKEEASALLKKLEFASYFN